MGLYPMSSLRSWFTSMLWLVEGLGKWKLAAQNRVMLGGRANEMEHVLPFPQDVLWVGQCGNGGFPKTREDSCDTVRHYSRHSTVNSMRYFLFARPARPLREGL